MVFIAAAALSTLLSLGPPQPSGCAAARAYAAASTANDLIALFHEDARYEDVTFGFSVSGRSDIERMLKSAFAAVQPFTRRIERVICDDSGAAVEWTVTGNHAAPMLGVAPTGRSVTIRAVSLLRVESGRLQKVSDYTDRATIESQLGIRR